MWRAWYAVNTQKCWYHCYHLDAPWPLCPVFSALSPMVFLPFQPRPDSREPSFWNEANPPPVPLSVGLSRCFPARCPSEQRCGDLCCNFWFSDDVVTEEQGKCPYPVGCHQPSTPQGSSVGHNTCDRDAI